jgi:phage shock protein A
MSLVIYVGFGIVAVFAIFMRKVPGYLRFKSDTEKLASLTNEEGSVDLVAPKSLFSGGSELEKAANGVLGNMVEAHERGLLQGYDINNSLKPLREAGSRVSSYVRTFAGIVIILGLLVTLFNLRASVGHLKSVFDNMKGASAQTNGPAAGSEEQVDALQNGMAGIANSATLAFGISAVFISFACELLFGAWVWAWGTTPGISKFERALHRLYFQIIPARRDESQLAGDLALAVQNLQDLSDTFKQTNTTLLQIGGFGDRFEMAAKEISEAVAKLPAGMRESVGDMSSQLARDIAHEMEHYVEHIKHIEAIYGDQQNLLTTMITAMSHMEDDWRRSSEALVELRALPDSIGKLKSAIDSSVTGAAVLNDSVAQLDKKVEGLPVKDLASAAGEMHEMATNLAPLVSAVQDVSNRMKELVAESVAESQREARDALLKTLADMNSKMTQALQEGLKVLTDEQKATLVSLNAMANSIALEIRRMGAGQSLLELAAKLQSMTEQLARVPKLPKFFAKPPAMGTAR